MREWTVGKEGRVWGVITHSLPPAFTACWTTGNDPEELSRIEGPVWTDEGSGAGEDAIHLFGFQWTGVAAGQDDFEGLMRCAARLIDKWISEHG